MSKLEIAAFNLPSALKACTAGASRIELCSDSSVGGLTPSRDTLNNLKSHLEYLKTRSEDAFSSPSPSPIPVYVMIRPHANSFTYSEEDIQAMESSISLFLPPGPDSDSNSKSQTAPISSSSSSLSSSTTADGFVFGCLSPTSASIDIPACTRLLAAARGRPCTFHRAFDCLPTSRVEEQLEILIELGFKAVLSSGGVPRAVDGVGVLRRMVGAARGRIDVVVGGGVRGENLGVLREGLEGVGEGGEGGEGGEAKVWFHSSAVVGEGEMASEEEVRRMNEMLCR